VRPQVLVVDDDPDVLRTLGRGLGHKGYAVLCAAAADSAYTILENQRIDVVVLDLIIPQIPGDTLALAITRRWPRMVGRVVLMSGDPSRIERLQLHGTSFPSLSKPFSLDQLCQLIETILQRDKDHRRDGTTDGPR